MGSLSSSTLLNSDSCSTGNSDSASSVCQSTGFYSMKAKALPIVRTKEDRQKINDARFCYCIAPPGRLGIIVETTPDGPLIYALKHSSPLVGIIKPGDIIIAMDDIDTTTMTAAELTRLMAEKSQN